MPRKKKDSPDPALPIQLNVRVTPDLDAALDRWTAEINYTQGSRIGRSDLLRGVLQWAVDHRPDWQAK